MSFFGSLFPRTPEPPEKRVYPPGWMIPLLEGGKSSTGVSVTVESAMKWTAFYAAVDLISNSVAQLPLHIYKRKADGGRERATGHPYYRLLHNQPNPEQTAFSYWKVQQGWGLTWGNGYAEIERDRSGTAKAFWPLPPNKMEVRREDGELVYVQKSDHGQEIARFPAINILHGHALGDGLVGWSPVRQFREAIGLGLGAEQYSAAFFANDASPGGVLQHPQRISEPAADRLRKSWAEKHAGIGNARKPAILEEGMEWKQMGIPPEDSQLIESRDFQVVDIGRVFHLPPHKLQDLRRATFANIEHLAIEYVQDCLGPWLVNWEQELNSKLFGTKAQSQFFAEFLTEGLLRGDVKTRSLFYRQMWGIGVMSQNEIRQRENMPPVEGGDKFFVPVNMAPVAALPVPPEPDAPDDEPEEPDDDSNRGRIVAAHRALLMELCGRIVRRETGAMRKAAKRFERFRSCADAFYGPHHVEHSVAVLGAAVGAYAAAMGHGESVEGYTKLLCETWVAQARAQLQNVAERRLPALMDEWEAKRPAQMTEKILGDFRHATSNTQ